MKKTLTLAAALILAVLLLGTAGGCKDQENFSEKSYSCAGEDVERVNIDVRDSAVEIAPSKDGTLRLAYYESEKRTYEIAFTNGTLSVSLTANGGTLFGVQSDTRFRTLRLFLPDGLRALSVSTTNENITLAPLAFRSAFGSAPTAEISALRGSLPERSASTPKMAASRGASSGDGMIFPSAVRSKRERATCPPSKRTERTLCSSTATTATSPSHSNDNTFKQTARRASNARRAGVSK